MTADISIKTYIDIGGLERLRGSPGHHFSLHQLDVNSTRCSKNSYRYLSDAQDSRGEAVSVLPSMIECCKKNKAASIQIQINGYYEMLIQSRRVGNRSLLRPCSAYALQHSLQESYTRLDISTCGRGKSMAIERSCGGGKSRQR